MNKLEKEKMNETEFTEMLRAEGYEGPEDFAMKPNEVSSRHDHDVDTVLLILEGSIVIAKPSGDVTCNVGDTVSYPAGEFHSEKAGPNGVKLVYGWRDPVDLQNT